jgi:hypothetical protein
MTRLRTETDKAYQDFHSKVVDACVNLMRGHCINDDGSKMTDLEVTHFFQNVCSYEEEFREGLTPEEVAEAQWDALT